MDRPYNAFTEMVHRIKRQGNCIPQLDNGQLSHVTSNSDITFELTQIKSELKRYIDLSETSQVMILF